MSDIKLLARAEQITAVATEIVDTLEKQTDGQTDALLAITIAASLFFNRQCELIFKKGGEKI